MDRIPLKAEERTILGKKVKTLRKQGFLPAHVFGRNLETEHVSVLLKEFLVVMNQAGETGLVDLKIGAEKVRPVLIREVQNDPVSDKPLHVDFYQVNLLQKVTVPVPVVLIGDEPESVHAGEAIVLQTLNELQVEALPTDLVENIEVNITPLKQIGDAITVSQLNYDRSKLTLLADESEVVVKLDSAVSKEAEELLAEVEAEAQVQATEAPEGETEEGGEAGADKSAEAGGGEESKEAGNATEGNKDESNVE